MGDHGRVLALVLGVQKEPKIDADDAAWYGKGVDLWAVDEHCRQCRLDEIGLFGEPQDVELHVVLEDGVVHRRRARADFLQRGASELALRG